MDTKKEIENQFETWSILKEYIPESIKEVIGNMTKDTIIIFSGAGTSGYIGDALLPILNQGLNRPKFFSYFSTHIVGDGEYLINNNQKILMISFGRSGNSPESEGAIDEVNRLCSNVEHIIITCNSEGKLAKLSDVKNKVILPKKTNDSGFAMTNSFTSMMIVAYYLFADNCDIHKVIKVAKELYKSYDYSSITNLSFENIIYLANTAVVGITSEYILKVTELTNGRYSYYHDHVLNFRHGPKSVITKKSLILIIKSTSERAQMYEEDLIHELTLDSNKPIIVVLGNTNEKGVVKVPLPNMLNDFELMLAYTPFVQRLALELSLKEGIDPDSPSPDNSVNRVVKGVIIH